MPPKAKKSRRKNNNKHWLHLRSVHVLFSVLVVSILIIAAVFFVLSKPVKYDGLSTAESTSGRLKISVPSVMEKNYTGDNVIDFEHRPIGSENSILAHVRVEAQYVDSNLLKDQTPQIRTQFKKGSGKFFEAFTRQPLSQPSAKNLDFSSFEQYSNGNLDGLIGDFSYQSQEIPVSGKLLIGFGEEEIYLVVAEATSEIWNENISTWEDVFESLEVGDGR
jgi:hypothetical protein